MTPQPLSCLLRWATQRRATRRWGRHWTWGYRTGEWWIGARRNLPADAIELNLLGLTLLIGPPPALAKLSRPD